MQPSRSRTIRVDDDVYAYLKANRLDWESMSETVARMVREQQSQLTESDQPETNQGGEEVPDPMVIGKKYKIRHKSLTQRYARESVMVYLGQGMHVDQLEMFSARPVAGTQSLWKVDIQSWELVDDATPISLNRRAS